MTLNKVKRLPRRAVQKIDSELKFKWSKWRLNQYEHVPSILYLEVTNKCNARCLVGDSKILMAGYTWKNLKDVSVGDCIIGVEEPVGGSPRKFVSSEVLEVFPAMMADVGYLELENGIRLGCTPDHRILSKHGRWIPANKLTNSDPPKWNASPVDYNENKDYLLGYLSGAWKSDGMIRIIEASDFDGYTYRARFAVKDEEFINYVQYVMEVFNLTFRRGKMKWNAPYDGKAIYIYNKENVLLLKKLIQIPMVITKDWARGFLAGFYDGDGNFSEGLMIRISNTKKELIDILSKCLDTLTFKWSVSKYSREKYEGLDCYILNVLGGLSERMRFFGLCQPKIPRKKRISSTVRGIMKITNFTLSGKELVYNLETETGNYIANGLIVHNCVFCGRNDVHKPLMHMDFDLFKSIVDAAPYTTQVHPQGFGEPLLYPHLVDAIRYCKERKKRVVFYTNASLLDEKMAIDLLESKVDQIRFSVDEITAELYEPLRRGLIWEEVLENIENFQYQKKKGKYKTETVARITQTKENAKRMHYITKFWSSRADLVVVSPEVDIPTFAQNHAEPFITFDGKIDCPNPYEQFAVRSNGDVVLCCSDWFHNYVITNIAEGSITQERILKIFNSDRYNKLRKGMETGIKCPSKCLSCKGIVPVSRS